MPKPSDSNSPLVVASGLSASYKDKPVWTDANFSVESGEFIAILGPNGSGKTTLFRLLLGLIEPSAGDLQLFGDKPKRGNARIGYIPQRRPIDSEMNIEAAELVRLGQYGAHWGLMGQQKLLESEEAAMKALKAVGASDLAHRPLGGLSGGELQRIFLAQALTNKPELLLLDEPLANLDINREAQLVKLISQIVRESHVTALLIAHDLNPLLPVLDRVIYIANGKVASGDPKEVITSEVLSELYGAPIEVLRDSKGRVAVLGVEEAAHHV